MTQEKEQQTTSTAGIVGLIARIRERANLIIEDELRERGITGIKPAHGSVLAFLFGQEDPVPMKDLVERLGRAKSTVTGMVNTLQRHGYLTKFTSPDDGRVVLVWLTEAGRALRPPFAEISARLQGRVYGGMAAEDREQLVRLLGVLEANLKRSNP